MDPIETQHRIAELESITREYARYANSAGGMSAVLGGVCCLVSFGIGFAGMPSPSAQAMLIALPAIWLASRHLLARHYYQRYGAVQEQIGAPRRRTQRWLTLGVLVLFALIVLGTWFDRDASAALRLRETSAYVAILLLLPLAALLWLRTPIDLVIGALLLSHAALAAVGRSFEAFGPATLLLPVALMTIVIGWRDHRRFIGLRERILGLNPGGDGT